MLGAIAGDIIGSPYEEDNIKTVKFPLLGPNSKFTDDTVLTIAVADCLLHKKDYTRTFQEYGRRYPNAGYGEQFHNWIFADHPEPYNSWGNGAAMRVSPVGFVCQTLEETLAEAEKSAAPTHDHPEGLKGARAVAAAVFLARRGQSKSEIQDYIQTTFQYNLSRTLDEIRPDYVFDTSSQGSVPEAIIAFLESRDYEDAIRKAVSLGGDSDTIACIAGGIAEAFYGPISQHIACAAQVRLSTELRQTIGAFYEKFQIPISTGNTEDVE